MSNRRPNGFPGGTLVSKSSMPLVMQYRWVPNGNGYLRATTERGRVYMHRLIIDAKPGEIVDHINRNRSDNRLSNLRIVSNSLSIHNKVSKGSKLGITGVYFHKAANKYAAEIRHEKTRYYLGLYETPIEAEQAYIEKRKELYGY